MLPRGRPGARRVPPRQRTRPRHLPRTTDHPAADRRHQETASPCRRCSSPCAGGPWRTAGRRERGTGRPVVAAVPGTARGRALDCQGRGTGLPSSSPPSPLALRRPAARPAAVSGAPAVPSPPPPGATRAPCTRKRRWKGRLGRRRRSGSRHSSGPPPGRGPRAGYPPGRGQRLLLDRDKPGGRPAAQGNRPASSSSPLTRAFGVLPTSGEPGGPTSVAGASSQVRRVRSRRGESNP